MKKNRVFALLGLALVLLFTSCYAKVVVLQEAQKSDTSVIAGQNAVQATAVAPKAESTRTPVTGEVKTGLSFVTSTTSSTSATDTQSGLGQSDATLVAVAVDENGVITDCVIDAVQAKVNFDRSGNITTDLSTLVRSKNELGDEYGMRKASSIGKEWNEQLSYLAEYVVGKTVDEVNGIAVSPKTSSDIDLASSVTLYIGSFLNGIKEAVSNAEYRGANAEDKLELVTYTTNSSSKAATGNSNGVVQSDITVAMVTLSGDVVTSCYIDSVQAKVNFDVSGQIVGEPSADVKTKNEIGDGYGMRKASSIGKEWNEQAAAYSEYVTGKSIDNILGIAVADSGKTTDADLLSSVTISIGNFQALFGKLAK